MNFLNLPVSIMRSPEMSTSSDEHAGIWLKLIAYCTEAETSGLIPGCADWPEIAWQRIAGIEKKTLSDPSELWRWNGNSLVVFGYNHKHEFGIKQKRKAAKMTNQRRLQNLINQPVTKTVVAKRNAKRNAERNAEQP